MPKFSTFSISFLAVILFSDVGLAQSGAPLDRARYIGLDEIRPGMEAYCLTVFSGTQVEKFDFEVVSVVRNIEPRRDAILVKGKDERFIHAGVVAGCSGSPVYVDGRLAGALAFGWSFSKEPVYGVTPIEEMFAAGTGSSGAGREGMQLGMDLFASVDLPRAEERIMSYLSRRSQSPSCDGLLPVPVAMSGVPEAAGGEFERFLGPLGLTAVAGLPAGASADDGQVKLEPGACLSVPLVSGDIELTVVGTATEVVGDQVLGFGHQLLGYGAVNLPMGTGKIHTVVASTMRSFKVGSPVGTVGTLTVDEAAGVRGIIGKAPDMIPMTIDIGRYNDPQHRSYKCEVSDNRLLTPLLLRICLYGAVLQRGALPPEHTLRYKTKIDFVGAEAISYENLSAGQDAGELLTETMVPVALAMNNPFKDLRVRSIEVEVEELDETLLANIRSVELGDYRVEQGGQISVGVVVEPIRGPRKRYTFDLDVPRDLKPGQYEILITGGYGYYEFLKKAAQQRFIAEDVDSLIEALNNILRIRRDRLYCVFILPEGGIALERAQLPDIPMTRALVLADATRTLQAQPYQHWLQKSLETAGVIIGEQRIQIEVTGQF